MDNLDQLIGALESLEVVPDASLLLRTAFTDGIPSCFADQMDGETLATLAATNRAAATLFGSPELWAKKLERATGRRSPPGDGAMLRRIYAHNFVCDRWRLPRGMPDESPQTDLQRRTAARRVAPTPLALRYQNTTPSSSSTHKRAFVSPVGKENEPPVFQHQNGGPAASQQQQCRPQALAEARLQRDLQELMAGGSSGVTAFPERPGEWSIWRARIPRVGAGQAALRLCFDLQSADAIPGVSVEEHTPFHPNVGSSGDICDAALRMRCAPTSSVRQVLLKTVELLDRPCFSVAPLNRHAAASWFAPTTTARALGKGDDKSSDAIATAFGSVPQRLGVSPGGNAERGPAA